MTRVSSSAPPSHDCSFGLVTFVNVLEQPQGKTHAGNEWIPSSRASMTMLHFHSFTQPDLHVVG